jgi:hypothetical protein
VDAGERIRGHKEVVILCRSASPLRDRRGACLYASVCCSRIMADVFVCAGHHQSAARFSREKRSDL